MQGKQSAFKKITLALSMQRLQYGIFQREE